MFLLAQPANIKFQWELDVVLTNIRSLSTEIPILLLFLEENSGVVEHFRHRYSNIEVFVYPDNRVYRDYLPAIRPYLCYQHWKAHPEAKHEVYFQIDSDIVFRELPDWSKLPTPGKVCWASDCSSYIDYDYLKSRKQGQRIIESFAQQLNIPIELIKETPGGGAQWLIAQPTLELWYHMWQDCHTIYNLLQPLDSDIQKWTSEMWSELYNLVKFGWQVKLSSELDFCRPTDPIAQWDKVKILHNAGVTGELAHELFYKGGYNDKMPFGEDFHWVNKQKASVKYIEKLYNVIQ